MPGKTVSPARILRRRLRRISSLTGTGPIPAALSIPTVFGSLVVVILGAFVAVRPALLAFRQAEGDDLARDDVGLELVDHDAGRVGIAFLEDAHPRLGVLGRPDLAFPVQELRQFLMHALPRGPRRPAGPPGSLSRDSLSCAPRPDDPRGALPPPGSRAARRTRDRSPPFRRRSSSA